MDTQIVLGDVVAAAAYFVNVTTDSKPHFLLAEAYEQLGKEGQGAGRAASIRTNKPIFQPSGRGNGQLLVARPAVSMPRQNNVFAAQCSEGRYYTQESGL
jgi:hypothetical protein